MKSSPLLSWVAVAIGTAAIALNLTAPRGLTEAEVEAVVASALEKKEQVFVAKHAPAFKQLFVEVMKDSGETREWNPKTLDELLDPLLKVLGEMSDL